MNTLSKNYLRYTFLIMLLGWGICVLFSFNGISLSDHKLLYVPYILGGWSPTIGSYLSLRKNNRVTGVKDWFKKVFDFRHNAFSYMLIVVMAVIFMLPQCLLSGYEKGAPFFAIIVMIPMMLIGGGLEEAGWRCILQTELMEKYSFTLSTIIVSIIWWLWHLPLFYIQGVFQYGQNYFAFGVNTLGLSFALACIRKNTGSVWLCVLFHCIINSLSGIYVVNENIKGTIATTIILILCSYGFVKLHDKLKMFS